MYRTIAVVFHLVVKSQNIYDRSLFCLFLKSVSTLLYIHNTAQLLNNIVFLRCVEWVHCLFLFPVVLGKTRAPAAA